MSRFQMNPSLLREIEKARDRAVKNAAEHLLEQSNRTIPIEEHIMEASGRATAEGGRGVVSWDTPYVVRQHEDTRLRHDSGRRAKWAERTFNEESSRIGQYIGQEMRKVL